MQISQNHTKKVFPVDLEMEHFKAANAADTSKKEKVLLIHLGLLTLERQANIKLVGHCTCTSLVLPPTLMRTKLWYSAYWTMPKPTLWQQSATHRRYTDFLLWSLTLQWHEQFVFNVTDKAQGLLRFKLQVCSPSFIRDLTFTSVHTHNRCQE